ncbi:tyrosine-type recombinase/integrase [Halalkalibacter akibai]|uniref:Integrase n=1 Tax=Halalkalibacter akibai (strain ATCC 43226 / DSM 21942 / CIP 109018 / JCM 9157 / 1139) TaxID=1236973 RepID=W4QWY4_HALA3|nr:tyrosine-type recombinase/integrase [Halalkalibacter akibai]GAE36640.1 integrase [Halalkalibacter akibai JCM 9157]
MAFISKYPVKNSKKGYKWYFRVYLGVDPATGKRLQKLQRGFETKKEAEAACSELVKKYSQGAIVTPPKKLLFHELIEKWILSKNKIRDVTLKKYQLLLKNHIVPGLGYIEVAKLTDEHLNRFYNELKVKKNLSSTSINDIHKLCKQILSYAVKKKILIENVATLVEAPQINKKQIQIWNYEDCRTFLDCVKEHREYIAFLIALTTGMRQSEILALTWKHVNFERNIISVDQTLERGKNALNPKVKSKNSQRSIRVDQETMLELKRQKRRIMKEKMFLGQEYLDYDLVIPTSKGTPISQRNLLRTFYRYIKKSGVRKIDFHDMRHTHASMLLQNGANPKAVSERLGHDTRTLMQTYAHIMPNIQEEIAADFGSTFYQQKQQKNRKTN